MRETGKKGGFEAPPTLYSLDEDEHIYFCVCAVCGVIVGKVKTGGASGGLAYDTCDLPRFRDVRGSLLMDRMSFVTENVAVFALTTTVVVVVARAISKPCSPVLSHPSKARVVGRQCRKPRFVLAAFGRKDRSG